MSPLVRADDDTTIAAKLADPKALLDTRVEGSPMFRSFNSFASDMYSHGSLSITTPSSTVSNAEISYVYPEFYKPTYKELFDSVARQARAKWAYDPASKQWKFTEVKNSVPFKVKIAEGWRSEDRGMYVWYAPMDGESGLNIYCMGHYTAPDKKKAAFFEKVRDDLALKMLKGLNRHLTVDDMKLTPVNDVDAEYYKTEQAGNVYRVWVFVKDGNAFAFSSTIDKDREDELAPQVKAMVKSFTYQPPTTQPAE